MRAALALLLAASLIAGCDRKKCDLSQFNIGMPAQSVVKACGLPDSIQIYAGQSDEQWSYGGREISEIYMQGNRIVGLQPYEGPRDDTIRIPTHD